MKQSLSRLIQTHLILFILWGCASTKKHWEKAQLEDTITGYKEYINKYPDSEFSTEAIVRLKVLEHEQKWKLVKTENSISGYDAFLTQNPKSLFFDLAKGARDSLCEIRDWYISDSLNTHAGYQNFIFQYPNSKYTENAKKHIDTIILQDWEIARNTNTLAGYNKFLLNHPKTQFTLIASQLIEGLGDFGKIVDLKNQLRENRSENTSHINIIAARDTRDSPHTVFKNSTGLYTKVTLDSVIEYDNGVNVPYLKFLRPYEGVVVYYNLDTLVENQEHEFRKTYEKLFFNTAEAYGFEKKATSSSIFFNIPISQFVAKERHGASRDKYDLRRFFLYNMFFETAKDSLIPHLTTTNPKYSHKTVIKAIGLLRLSDYSDYIIHFLDDERADIRLAALQTLYSFRLDPPDSFRSDTSKSTLNFSTVDSLRSLARKRELREHKILKILIHAIDSPYPELRVNAATYICDLSKGGQGVNYLIGLLQHTDSEIRKLASNTLDEMFSQSKRDIKNFGVSEDSALKLINTLQNLDYYSKKTAIKILGRIEEKRASNILIQFLDHSDTSLRNEAVIALAQLESPLNTKILIKHGHCVPYIINSRSLSDDFKKKGIFEDAFGYIRNSEIGEKTIKDLSEFIELTYTTTRIKGVHGHTSPASYLRGVALKFLGLFGTKSAISVLISELKNWETGIDAANSLEMIGWKATLFKDKVHFFISKKKWDFLKRNWKGTKQVLLENLHSSNPSKIDLAIRTFIAIGKKDIIDELVLFLNEQNSKAKSIANLYLNSGESTLKKAGETWVKKHGYTILHFESSTDSKWGRLPR